jgi:hypothetical protein
MAREPRMINHRKQPLRVRMCEGIHGHRECGGVAEYRRQATAYHDDKQNFDYFCDECQKESDDRWEEMWAEWRSSQSC